MEPTVLSAPWIFLGFLYFSLFSSVTSAALNTIQISYGISYFRHRDSSDIFTYDIAQQSVVDKMVGEISLEVREKSGNFVFTFLWEPCFSIAASARRPRRREHSNSKNIQRVSFKFYMRVDKIPP